MWKIFDRDSMPVQTNQFQRILNNFTALFFLFLPLFASWYIWKLGKQVKVADILCNLHFISNWTAFYFQGNTVRLGCERDDGDVSTRDESCSFQARRRAPRVVQLEQLVAVEAAPTKRLPTARHAAGRGGQHHARTHRADRAEERGGADQRPATAGRRGRGRRRARRQQGGARHFGQHGRQLSVNFQCVN